MEGLEGRPLTSLRLPTAREMVHTVFTSTLRSVENLYRVLLERTSRPFGLGVLIYLGTVLPHKIRRGPVPVVNRCRGFHK